MKLNFPTIYLGFSVLIFGSLCSISASAQEESDTPTNAIKESAQNAEASDDKPALSEHDSKTTRVRDSTHMRTAPLPVTKGKSSEQAKPSASKEDDDVLSFNFLYYIIQKFKISDLIDN